MRRFSNHFGRPVIVLVFTLLASSGTRFYAQTEPRARAEETAEWWNQIGNKLIAVAKDFPEDKYDFKVQADQRTFAQNLLHVAAPQFQRLLKIEHRRPMGILPRISTCGK
jgi:hypothetical protein